MTDKKKLTKLIKEKASELGFTECGTSKAEYLSDDALKLENWLKKGMHGEMRFMENHFEKRTDPCKLVEGTKSVISVLFNYFPQNIQVDPQAPVISKYAYGKDYHYVIKRKLGVLLDFIKQQDNRADGRFFVDSAPVLDRAWAAKSGLGWIGKNSMLISKKHGSFVFIGEILLNTELEYDSPINDFCGSCTLCIDACPTVAILPGRQIDSNRCISYLTIEYRGKLPENEKVNFKNRVFGCDICQDVCPWNKKAKPHNEPAFVPMPELLQLSREDWKNFTRADYKKFFKNTAVERTGYKGLKRNIEFLAGG